jgi:nitroreductase
LSRRRSRRQINRNKVVLKSGDVAIAGRPTAAKLARHMSDNSEPKLSFLFARRSIRTFRPDVVPNPCVQRLLEAAMAAPSAVARDPWRFVVIRSGPTRGRLAEVLSNGQMLLSAPVAIAVCGELAAAHDQQLSYLLQDCSAAIENLLLAASALGLGTCWLGVHPREQRMASVAQILALPAGVIPVAVIALGWPAEVKEPRTRFNAANVHAEQW